MPCYILIVVFLGGTAGFVWIEGYDIVNAFYMTVITVSTVGFGEVQPLSDAGKVFTIAFGLSPLSEHLPIPFQT